MISYNIYKDGEFQKKIRGSFSKANRYKNQLSKDGSNVYMFQSLV